MKVFIAEKSKHQHKLPKPLLRVPKSPVFDRTEVHLYQTALISGVFAWWEISTSHQPNVCKMAGRQRFAIEWHLSVTH